MVNSEDTKEVDPTKQLHRGVGVRHLQAALAFGGVAVPYILRLNLSVAVVGMETSTQDKVELGNKEKALVLSSLLWGYGFLQVPSGAWGRRGYAVLLFALANFIPGLLTIIIPYAAMNFGYIGICVLRFLVGLFQGSVYPNLNNLMANWLIPSERDAIMCVVQSGALVGCLLSTFSSGYIGYYFGWPSIFYVSGLVGVIWGITHYVLGAEDPDSCKRLSDGERAYMQQCFRAENKEVNDKKSEVPWKEIFTSVPFITLCLTAWSSAWCEWTMMTLIPTYINGVLGFELDDNGLITGVSYLCSCLTMALISFTSWIITNKTNIPDSFMRPFWNSLGLYGVAAVLLVLAYAPLNVPMAVTLVIVETSICGASNLGYLVNSLDLSPNYAGVLFSIVNTIGNISAILGPLVSTYLIEDESNLYQWRLVFSISAGLSFFGNTVFIIWGSTKKQPWDVGKKPIAQKV